MKRAILFTLLAVMIFPQIANAGSIAGTVTRDSDGLPISGLWVWASNYNTSDYGGGDHTDVNGVYLITGLDTGSYRVQISGSGTQYASQFYDDQVSWDQATPVSVSAGQQTANIDFSLALGGSISGTVTEPNGAAQANIRVNCWANNGYGTGGLTNANRFYVYRGRREHLSYNVTA